MRKSIVLLFFLFFMSLFFYLPTNQEIIKIDCGENILVNDVKISRNKSDKVYLANDLITNTLDDNSNDNVIHIVKSGIYEFSGELKGQIFIDLGRESEYDKNSKVTLILNDINITCDKAPCIVFYNVYESNSIEDFGANIIIKDGTVNNLSGGFVTPIMRPYNLKLENDNLFLNDKYYKYDGTIHSKMSLRIIGENNNGVLNINAKNEGISSEYHLLLDGVNANIVSDNDSINGSKDNISIINIKNSNLDVLVIGDKTGDGIDSNGSLFIEDSYIKAQGCELSEDVGIDAVNELSIMNSQIISFGNMTDGANKINQPYLIFNFARNMLPGKYILRSENGEDYIFEADNKFLCLFIVDGVPAGKYTLWYENIQLKVKESDYIQGINQDCLVNGKIIDFGEVIGDSENRPNVDYTYDLHIKEGSNYFNFVR